MAASAALAGTGCSGPPAEPILPYVTMPEQAVPGQPVFYASALVRRGLAHPVLVETQTGRPIKVEGNPEHPASRGATDAFAQASILQLWDPDRSQTPYRGEEIASWGAFEGALAERLAGWRLRRGEGLRILTGDSSSPTLAGQWAALAAQMPQARRHAWDPQHDDGAALAAQMVFGQAVDMRYRLQDASVVLAVQADLFGDWPGALSYARDWVDGRRLDARPGANRLYVLESQPTITGAFADNRLARSPQEIEQMLWRIAGQLGMAVHPGGQDGVAAAGAVLGGSDGSGGSGGSARWEAAAARALAGARGRGLVVAGPGLSVRTRALAHLINARLGNLGRTALPIAPVSVTPPDHGASLAELVAEMRAGRVEGLLILDTNPVYDAPADLEFAAALQKVPFSAHLGLYRDETGRATQWHLPMTHSYEAWSDARCYDGSTCIVQPVMAPLYGGRSAHALLSMLIEGAPRDDYQLLRQRWLKGDERGELDAGSEATGGGEAGWRAALRRGMIQGSAAALSLRAAGRLEPQTPQPHTGETSLLTLVFTPDPASDGGAFSNNAWLHELPRPLSQITWDNAAILGPATARSLGVASGDILELRRGQRVLNAPVHVMPQHAEQTISVSLGYGRRNAGRVGNGVGVDAYALRTLDALTGTVQVNARRVPGHHSFAFRQQELNSQQRPLIKVQDVEHFQQNPQFARAEPLDRVPRQSMYPAVPAEGYQWAMSIDLNACIGCGACTIACQAENNIPVVGPEEIQRGRIMHWIRIDHYEDQGLHAFQPVPCMHCENAPCEEVCPVGATVHDSEGLNVQVYNRCVGTRFCSNNCPYKVRRFNFLQYADQATEQLKAQRNPEVTVRRRGVMEKCSYCLQRITRGRIDAEKAGRKIRDGEVVTACQGVCPTRAIVFGDLSDPASAVAQAKRSPLDYSLLAELNTRPRTTYAARVVNPDPEAS